MEQDAQGSGGSVQTSLELLKKQVDEAPEDVV